MKMRTAWRLSVSLLPLLLHGASTLAAPMASGIVAQDAEQEKLHAILTFVRGRNARDYAIPSDDGIDEGRFVELGGIDQWITIRGEHRTRPVLLFLHGGPGDATNPWGYAVFRSWLKEFVVVQWDQRGAGRTLGRNPTGLGPTLTIERMVRDGVELTEHLRKSLGREKVVLVGHAWGSILGTLMAKARPDLFYAYVGTGQVADPAQTYGVAFAELLRKADALGDSAASTELREVGPPPYADGRGYAVQRKWSNLFEGADRFIASMMGLALVAPGYTLRDINDWLDGQGFSAEHLVPQSSGVDAETLAGSFDVPVFVIQGADDFTTPTSLAKAWLDGIDAREKDFVTLERGGHFVVFMQPEAFLKELVSRVLPQVTRR